MATIQSICPDCSTACSLSVNQSFAPGELVWSQAFQCTACGSAIEVDGHGFPPNKIRTAIIESDGLWGLHVDLTDSQRLAVCKILYSDLNTKFSEVPSMKNRIPGIVYAGTRTEMQWLQTRLAEFGFASKVVEVDPDSIPPSAHLPIKHV